MTPADKSTTTLSSTKSQSLTSDIKRRSLTSTEKSSRRLRPKAITTSVFNIIKASSVRVCLILHNILAVWRVTVNWNNNLFWILLFANIPFILEGLYTVLKRKGIEWKWLCPCFLFYLLSTVPNIWLLEISSMNKFGNINSSAIQEIEISGVKIPIRLDADTWKLVVEESLLYLMILGRWFLPRGHVTREQLSELLFAFIGIASDIMELFALFDEKQVRSSASMTFALLGIWSWSILQFTLVVTVSQRPKRRRIQRIQGAGEDEVNKVLFEIIGIFISLFMQDIPFLVLRLYTMITFDLVKYSLVFFTAKNVLVILLLWYRLIIMCANQYCKKGRRLRSKASSTMPLDTVVAGLDNYTRFDDVVDEQMFEVDNDNFVDDNEKMMFGIANSDFKAENMVDLDQVAEGGGDRKTSQKQTTKADSSAVMSVDEPKEILDQEKNRDRSPETADVIGLKDFTKSRTDTMLSTVEESPENEDVNMNVQSEENSQNKEEVAQKHVTVLDIRL